MKRAAVMAAALLTVGCHRAATLAPDAAADDQNQTAAKTLADLAAADRAAATPLRAPAAAPARPHARPAAQPSIDKAALEDDAPVSDGDDNGA